MSQALIRRCDHPPCGVEIPPPAKVWEFRAVLTLHNGETREAETGRELCSQGCLMATMSELIKAVESAPGRADCHSLGMKEAIR